MPTAGTHITVVEQLALQDGEIAECLGNPLARPDTDEGLKMCFAKLGAVGPDVFYMLGDFNNAPATALQDLENFLVKVGGAMARFSEISEKVNKWLTGEMDTITAGLASEVQQSTNLITGVITNMFLATLVNRGVNVWAAFRSPRQQGYPRESWFWADCLHYAYTGEFVKRLLANAPRQDEPNLHAYALGYLTHYITDVVGHPYVNQVVQGPYRMHWQRHHLVENFIDAYVWDRWHRTRDRWEPDGPPPGPAEELPLDEPTVRPNAIEGGAPILTARLHDHVNIGVSTFGHTVDDVVNAVADKIEKGLFDIGVLEDINVEPSKDSGFQKWCALMADTVQEVYSKYRHPTILAKGLDPRPGGFPTAEDVAGAYGVLRLLFKVSTEEKIQAPVFPNVGSDITSAIEHIADSVAKDIGGIPPVPIPNTGGAASPAALMDALARAAQWAGEAARAAAKAVADIVNGIAGAGEVAPTDLVKVGLWYLNSALYTMYRDFRDILVLNAYSSPFTEELTEQIGGVNANDLWAFNGSKPGGGYPAEENPRAREPIGNSYQPFMAPAAKAEEATLKYPGPYLPGRPEAFLEAPAGKDKMFNVDAPQKPDPTSGTIFTDKAKEFGGAIENCRVAILSFERYGTDIYFPNFDMDGDRGYAWPGWEVDDPIKHPLDPKVAPSPVVCYAIPIQN